MPLLPVGQICYLIFGVITIHKTYFSISMICQFYHWEIIYLVFGICLVLGTILLKFSHWLMTYLLFNIWYDVTHSFEFLFYICHCFQLDNFIIWYLVFGFYQISYCNWFSMIFHFNLWGNISQMFDSVTVCTLEKLTLIHYKFIIWYLV